MSGLDTSTVLYANTYTACVDKTDKLNVGLEASTSFFRDYTLFLEHGKRIRAFVLERNTLLDDSDNT